MLQNYKSPTLEIEWLIPKIIILHTDEYNVRYNNYIFL